MVHFGFNRAFMARAKITTSKYYSKFTTLISTIMATLASPFFNN